jgi:hypothetical protein
MRKIFYVLCLSMPFAVAKSEQIPVEDFAKPMEYRDAILSSDGKYIAKRVRRSISGAWKRF